MIEEPTISSSRIRNVYCIHSSKRCSSTVFKVLRSVRRHTLMMPFLLQCQKNLMVTGAENAQHALGRAPTSQYWNHEGLQWLVTRAYFISPSSSRLPLTKLRHEWLFTGDLSTRSGCMVSLQTRAGRKRANFGVCAEAMANSTLTVYISSIIH